MTESSSTLMWILFFYVYCFLGWCVESLYVSYFQKKWVNRGFMHGPYIPLYGSGALIVTYVTLPVKNSVLLTFVIGAVAASVLEYVTGVLMEAIFKVRYWDYSNKRFNLNGHICLLNTVEWGFLSVFLVFVLDRPIAAFVNAMTLPIQMTAVVFISILFVTDFALSVRAAFDVRDMIIKMTEAKEEIYRLQRRVDVMIAVADDSFDNWKEEKREIMEGRMEALEERFDLVKNMSQEKKAESRLMLKSLQDQFAELLETVKLQRVEKTEQPRFTEEFREELDALKERFQKVGTMLPRMESYFGTHKRNLLLNSPTATSKKFKEAFEELVALADTRRKKNDDSNDEAGK
ncbi:MAG: hypothetical protein Q4B70_08685 [Lachnospiraceae bacterium]|nr:hypothetical protein [Lachnospiraceae bacterium]